MYREMCDFESHINPYSNFDNPELFIDKNGKKVGITLNDINRLVDKNINKFINNFMSSKKINFEQEKNLNEATHKLEREELDL